jgi:hypothetical protein
MTCRFFIRLPKNGLRPREVAGVRAALDRSNLPVRLMA